MPSGHQSSSQTPRETPSLDTTVALDNKFFRSDRNIRTLLLLVSCDVTSVERTFSCQTVKRLKALTFNFQLVHHVQEEGLLPFRQPLAGIRSLWPKGSRILSRPSSERLFFCSGVQSGEEAGLFSWTSVWVGAPLVLSSSSFFSSCSCLSWSATRVFKALSSALTAAMSLRIVVFF